MKKPKAVRVRATIEYEPEDYTSLRDETEMMRSHLWGPEWRLKRLRVERVPEKRRKSR